MKKNTKTYHAAPGTSVSMAVGPKGTERLVDFDDAGMFETSDADLIEVLDVLFPVAKVAKPTKPTNKEETD